MSSKLLTLFVMIAGLLLVALLTLNADVAWMAMPFLAYLAIGILRSPAVERIRIDADRSVEQITQFGERRIQVTARVRNLGQGLDQLLLSDQQQMGMRSLLGNTQQRCALQKGEEISFTYTFQAHRGQYTWKSVHAVALDPLGILESHLDVPAEAVMQVQPELVHFKSLPVRPQRTLHLAGSIPARLGGSGTNFWGIREYQTGDPLRRLDWHHVARHPGQLYTREFEQEEITEIGLILDARQFTDIRIGEESLFEYSTRAAASLAEVFLRQGNRVCLLVYSNSMISVYPGYGKVQLNRILNTLTQVRTEAGESLGSLQLLPVQMFSNHSIILVISPLATGDYHLFSRLRALEYQVVLVSPNPIAFAQQMLPNDLPSKLSVRLAQVERQLEIKKITRMWVPMIDWDVHQPLLPLVRSALNYSHLQHKKEAHA